jgi:hypothetical protein
MTTTENKVTNMCEDQILVRGKVAKLLNTREVALNIGAQDGVTIGMRFAILDTEECSILDPDTGDALGSIERPKAFVKAIVVEERVSVARTYRKREVNIGGTSTALTVAEDFMNSLLPPRWVTRYETLRLEEAPHDAITEAESFVKVGDPVVQLLDEEAD